MKRTGIGFCRAMAAMHPPLAVPSSLVSDEPGHAERVVESLDLRDRVLPGVGVQHQQLFVRRVGVGLLR